MRMAFSSHTEGTKADVVEHRQVDPEKALAYAKQLGIPYIETSAKSAHQVRRESSSILSELEWSQGSSELVADFFTLMP